MSLSVVEPGAGETTGEDKEKARAEGIRQDGLECGQFGKRGPSHYDRELIEVISNRNSFLNRQNLAWKVRTTKMCHHAVGVSKVLIKINIRIQA